MQIRIKLFRGNGRTFKFIIIEGEAIHLYLGYNIVATEIYITGIASLINGLCGKGTSIIDFTLSINETILC
jgi:hypothetical protein